MICMRRIPTLPHELIIEIFLWLPVMSLMRFRCVPNFFDALVLDSDFTYVHHLHSMTRDGGTKFLMGKAEDLHVVDLNEEGNTSRWNFDCHDQYFNAPCVNGSYCIWKHDKEPIRIFTSNTRKMIVLPYQRKKFHSVKSLYYYSLGYEPVEKKYKVLMQVHNQVDFMKIFPIKGFIYIMDYSKNSIIAFDFRAENFRVIGLGNDICAKIFNYDLIEVKGKIELLDCCGSFSGKNDLWILEIFEKEEWKSHAIHIPSQWKDVEDILKPKYGPPQGFCDSHNDFTRVHHLLSMTCDGGTKFLMGKAEDLYIVDLNEEGNTSRWNFDCHNQYFNALCANGSYCI
ncbi:hypothetical protein H5410_015256 [Solanum commersonii]|uniref:F-box domain-containing protein n=1 Tax=Solanum commersonii TaxID=4109 RepID=A0A9J5ZTB8_SOLCO|nr:hypothetical protein H5410_015256 [Solanum commersonii]